MWSVESRTAAIACGALAPSAIKSSTRGPSAGSVTFWLATAPTPARAWAQRAATAGDDDATATPKRPVSAQRATIEKVTGAARGSPR